MPPQWTSKDQKRQDFLDQLLVKTVWEGCPHMAMKWIEMGANVKYVIGGLNLLQIAVTQLDGV